MFYWLLLLLTMMVMMGIVALRRRAFFLAVACVRGEAVVLTVGGRDARQLAELGRG